MKIAFIFGKGIDGCGVTRGALIFENYLRQAGHDTFIVDFDNGQTKPITFAGNFGTNVGTNESSTSNLGVTINTELMKVAYAQGLPIVDNNTSNDTPPLEVLIDKLIGVFYVEPLDNTPGASVNIAVNNIFIVTNDGNLDIGTVPPDAYTFVIPAAPSTASATYTTTGYLPSPNTYAGGTYLRGLNTTDEYILDKDTNVLYYAVNNYPVVPPLPITVDSYACAYGCTWTSNLYVVRGAAVPYESAPAALSAEDNSASQWYTKD